MRRHQRPAARPDVGDLLKGRILEGDFAPGQRLVETELASRFDTSRGAVRAALIDLAGDGLVERIPNRGAVVRVVSVDEAIEITECRMALEGLCAGRAALRITADDGRELEDLVVAMRDQVTRGDLLGYSALNQRLHLSIQRVSGQATAARAIERLRGQFVRHQFRLALRPGRARASLPEHERIVAAIVARDPELAERRMRAHLHGVVEALRETAPPTVDREADC